MAKKHTAFPHVHSLYIRKEEVKTPIYTCVRVRVRACDYIIEKYKRKMCYHAKKYI